MRVTPFVLESEYPGTTDVDVPRWWASRRRSLRRRRECIVEGLDRFGVETVDGVAAVLGRVFDGERPPTDPVGRARRFDWDRVADDALAAYRDAFSGSW